MLVKQIGEFALIERIRKLFKTDSSVIKGSGDDCAVLKLDKNNYQLFTCDMLVEGVDFTKHTDLYLVGRKALAVSISDIAACGGIPRYALVAIGMPENITLKSVDKIVSGINDLAKLYHINVVGGDISRAAQLVIDVSMLGIVEKKCLVLREGARNGDIIFVTGELGGTLKGKHLRFIPRIKEARFLVKNFQVSSMIDISDGLIQDLNHILEINRAGAVIYESLIPLSKLAKNLEDALYGGEDFELLFTLSSLQARRFLRKLLKNFSPIGEIVDQKYGLKLIKKSGQEKNLKPKGFCHF